MALSNTVFTPGAAPDHSTALTNIALNRPDVFKAFSQGLKQSQDRALALQQYREAKVKADLAEALYPGNLGLQRALQAQQMNALKNPSQYTADTSAAPPISTTPKSVSVTNNDGTTVTTKPSDPGSPPVITQPAIPVVPPPDYGSPGQFQPQPMIRGVADNSDYSTPFDSSDFTSPA